MAITLADIYEAVYLCTAETQMADAFRAAVGLERHGAASARRVAYPRRSIYADVDFERLMGQRSGVQL